MLIMYYLFIIVSCVFIDINDHDRVRSMKTLTAPVVELNKQFGVVNDAHFGSLLSSDHGVEERVIESARSSRRCDQGHALHSEKNTSLEPLGVCTNKYIILVVLYSSVCRSCCVLL